MQAIGTARRLDVRGWIRGVISAVVSGGAGAAGGSLGAVMADPEHFAVNTGSGLHGVLVVAGYAFAVSAIISLMKFLQTTPIPQEESPTIT